MRVRRAVKATDAKSRLRPGCIYRRACRSDSRTKFLTVPSVVCCTQLKPQTDRIAPNGEYSRGRIPGRDSWPRYSNSVKVPPNPENSGESDSRRFDLSSTWSISRLAVWGRPWSRSERILVSGLDQGRDVPFQGGNVAHALQRHVKRVHRIFHRELGAPDVRRKTVSRLGQEHVDARE